MKIIKNKTYKSHFKKTLQNTKKEKVENFLDFLTFFERKSFGNLEMFLTFSFFVF